FTNISRIDPAYVYLPGDPSQSNGLLIRAARSPRDTLAAIRTSLESFDRSLLPTLGFLSLDNFMHSQEFVPQAAAILTAILAFLDRKSTRLNSSHGSISYAVFCLK